MLHIIWDFDGTLIDTAEDIYHYLEVSVKQTGIDPALRVKPIVIGPPLDKMLRNAYPEDVMDDSTLKKAVAAFRDIYDNSGFERTRPFPGIEEIVADTKNFTHHIVTNKPDLPTKRLLEKFNLSRYMSSIVTSYTKLGPNGEKRPKTELFAEVIAEFGGDASRFVGIGDVKTDCIAARENNITAIGVLWGAGTRDELTDHCDYLFENVGQLRGFLYRTEVAV